MIIAIRINKEFRVTMLKKIHLKIKKANTEKVLQIHPQDWNIKFEHFSKL